MKMLHKWNASDTASFILPIDGPEPGNRPFSLKVKVLFLRIYSYIADK